MSKFAYLTPSSFGLALFCFLLPWINIRCDSPRGGPFAGQGIDIVETTQSGLQMCYGGSTTTVNNQPLDAAQQQQLDRQLKHRKLAAPTMGLYALALLLGLVASLVVQKPDIWFRIVCSAGGVAAIVLIAQLAVGFPIVEGVPRAQNNNGWSYTVWFWLGIAATLSALATAVARRLVEPRPIRDEASLRDETGQPVTSISAEVRARHRRQIVIGIMAGLGSLALLAIALFVWPGFARKLPTAGVAMSGYTDYMLSDEHVAAIKPGMTLRQVQAVLDIAQEKMQPPPYIRDLESWNKDRQQTGKGNLGIFEMSLERIASSKEYWFSFAGSYRTITVRVKDGLVAEIKDSRDETD